MQVFVRHTTAAVRIQENEPLLLDDLRRFLASLAPADADYGHNDFRVRTHHMHPDERPNGHSHCLQLLLGSSESVPISDGELALGAWQRLFLVELDGPRPQREVLLQVVGQARRGGGRHARRAPSDSKWLAPADDLRRATITPHPRLARRAALLPVRRDRRRRGGRDRHDTHAGRGALLPG